MAGCLNGGSCLFDEGKDTFACSCSPHWRGEKCEMGKSKLFLFLKYDRQYRRRVKDVSGRKRNHPTFYTLYVAILFSSKERVIINLMAGFLWQCIVDIV